MKHAVEQGDVFREHYSRNTNNIDVVRIRLGEVAGTEESVAGETLRVGLFN
jgi:hypothetical protein